MDFQKIRNGFRILFFIVNSIAILVPNHVPHATTYYVATNGSDSNTGLDTSQALATISTAISKVIAGDTIYVRGGIYTCTATITVPSETGSNATLRCCLFAYPTERPVLDFSSMTGTSTDGLKINGSYWYVKGIDFKGAPHNGIKISGGSHNIIEFCSSYENRNTGVQLAAGASYNRIINCDSYNNRDVTDGNADGFSPKLDVGTSNYFYGCRSWQNSDDGWDGYLRPSDDVTDTLENCWSFMNGYYKDGVTVGAGNGNGFKTGGCDANASGLKLLKHNMVLKNCLSFYNKAKGFDQNHNRGSITFLNCTGYNNGNGSTSSGDEYNFSVPETLAISAGKILTVENCISLGSASGVTLLNPTILLTNSWMSPFTAPTNADFISVDTTGVRGPRKSDGSLPDITFMHLASSSQFIDAGTDVGLLYHGSKPDLGCFETEGAVGVVTKNSARTSGFVLFQNYPNPFNPVTIIPFTVERTGVVTLKVYNLLGQCIAELYHGVAEGGKEYRITFDAKNLPTGIYTYSIESGNQRFVKRMVLLK